MNSKVQHSRLVIADDHTLVRAGMRALLEKMPNVEVVGEASNGRDTLALVATQSPDIVLMDVTMPGLNGLEVTARLATQAPSVKVIILSMHESEEYYWRALRAGASGYLLKKAAIAELETAIEEVMRGGVYLSREMSARLLKRFPLPLHPVARLKSPLEQLSERQREILQLLVEGQNTKQIADLLKLSPKTVEYHRAKLMHGLGVHDIPGLVRLALREGIISHDN